MTPDLLLRTFDFNGQNIVAILGVTLYTYLLLINVQSIYFKITYR